MKLSKAWRGIIFFIGGNHYLQEKVSACLSSYKARRWCMFEWFYSAIDYPWFSKREFMEYLNHVGLGNIPRLTRVEWSVIKRYEIHLLSVCCTVESCEQ